MPLTEVAPGLSTIVHVMNLPAALKVSTRMSVVTLAPGELLLHSPTPIDDALAAQIAGLGAVRWVVAPSRHHNLFVAPAMARFPDAALYVAPGMEKSWPGLAPAGTLGEGTGVPWTGALERVFLDGAPGFSESAFFHPPSRSLIESDLLFNVTQVPNWTTGLLLRVIGVYGRLASSRAWRLMAKDKAALKASVAKVLAWDFVRIVAGHGDIDAGDDVHARARQALGWFLK